MLLDGLRDPPRLTGWRSLVTENEPTSDVSCRLAPTALGSTRKGACAEARIAARATRKGRTRTTQDAFPRVEPLTLARFESPFVDESCWIRDERNRTGSPCSRSTTRQRSRSFPQASSLVVPTKSPSWAVLESAIRPTDSCHPTNSNNCTRVSRFSNLHSRRMAFHDAHSRFSRIRQDVEEGFSP